ncbi:unnamed protein product [Meloidogyne enterolobii]|uniref:Uncharacterized protein n=1 Tax=Meloidogyne enterolobii TaxID=390850 RepID=A0ACB0XZ58_MELEN
MQNKQAGLESVYFKERNVHSDNKEGTSFENSQNEDFGNKGKLPIVYEGNIHFEGNPSYQKEESKDETETCVDEQNQTVVEEPNKIPENCMNQIDLNEYPFDLNEKPEDEDEDVC